MTRTKEVVTSILATILLAIGIVIAIAACGSGNSTSSSPVSPAQGLANPVSVLKKAGATTQDTVGTPDVNGDLYADGTMPSSKTTESGCTSYNSNTSQYCAESLTVYTYKSTQDQHINGSTASDQYTLIRGQQFDIQVYPVTMPNGKVVYKVSPQVIAQRVDGTVITANRP